MRALIPLLIVAGCKQHESKPPPSPPPAPPAPAPSPAPVRTASPADLVRGANRFALELWKQAPSGDVRLAPAAIAASLVLVWGGAKGESATQIGDALGLSGAPDIVLGEWGNMVTALGKRVPAAIRLYADKSAEVDTTYFTIVRHAFDVWIEPVDFANDADGVRDKINTWFGEQTKLKPFIEPDMLKPWNKLALISALDFQRDWAAPFDATRTAPRPFWRDGKWERQVATMQRQGTYRVASNELATLVELPYKDNTAAMYLIVPAARDGLAAVEPKLGETLKTLEPELAATDITLSLPKVTTTPKHAERLDAMLGAAGITMARDPEHADLAGIASARLFVSSVIQRARVTISEGGTATPSAAAPGARALSIDHPFDYVIVDRATGLFVLIGRVVDPA
jgi:serine protease inhibitor